MIESVYHQPDLELLEGEHPNLRVEAANVCGDEWLDLPNTHFGGRTPEQTIQDGWGALVRDVIRSIKYCGIS